MRPPSLLHCQCFFFCEIIPNSIQFCYNTSHLKRHNSLGTSLNVQWLRLPSIAGNVGRIPGQGTKIPHATVVCPKLLKK